MSLLLLLQIVAAITFPAQGDTLTGSVAILGTAAHPQFERYEIAFAYDPNPTDTWFEIQPPSSHQVTDGSLAVWDTQTITDGTYMIRLRVYAVSSNIPAETVVRNLKIRDSTPTLIPDDAATDTPLAPTATSALLDPTATLLMPPTPPVGTPTVSGHLPAATPPLSQTAPPSAPVPAVLDLSTYTSAFCNGIYFAGGAFLILGIYRLLRDRIRRPIRRWIRRVISDIRKP